MRIFDDYTAVEWGSDCVRLYYINHDSTEVTLEETVVYEYAYKELTAYLNDRGSVWEFENDNVRTYGTTDPAEILYVLGTNFDAFVSNEDLDRYLLGKLERKLERMEV